MRAAAMVILLLLAGVVQGADAPLARDRLVERQQAGQAPLLLDVRRSDEYHDGHIQGAINIPVEQLAQRYTALGVPRDTEIVVYCVSGKRASRAQALLEERGFTQVRLLDGSMNAWREEHRPVVREDDSPN